MMSGLSILELFYNTKLLLKKTIYMKQIRIYQTVILLLVLIIGYFYFTFVKNGVQTKKNYNKYLEKIPVQMVPLREKVAEHYMSKYQSTNPDNFHGIVLTDSVIDFFKTYLDNNPGYSISVGFTKYDTTGFGSTLSDTEFEKRQNHSDPSRKPLNKYGVVFGIIGINQKGILPFNVGGKKFYDNWNDEWP